MIELSTDDFAAALDAFDRLGMRVDMIMPADDPRVAELSNGDLKIRLASSAPERARDRDWHTGRAGMQYRDLIPDRMGGRFIASHIRVPDGGPVPDYVHYHAIRIQLIYCYRGWVRLVYEDQGEPFVMIAGDCVLQPPHIRHRVLECSPGLEVIELASPACHPTYRDHELALPNPTIARERDFGGQTFAWLRGGPGGRPQGFSAMAIASGGLATLRERCDVGRIEHDRELYFGFVLAGTLAVDGRGLGPGDAFVVEHSAELTAGSAELRWLEITVG